MLTLFFDLDGTLIDPKEGITQAIQHALGEMGMEDIPHANDLTWCIGPPLWNSFDVLLGPGADLDQAVDFYRAFYTDEAMYLADVYDGVGEMFDALHQVDAKMFITTSKPHVYAQEIIEHFGIHAHVEQLFGSELDGTNSDKTDLLKHALDETGADPAKTVMIGDRRFDIFGARNNDIPSVGALWGYGEPDELRQSEADALAGAPEEVPEIVFDLLGLDAD
ncbi:HAD hydrolase-like protein [Neptunicoccus sediminis]|uniref:HAD hydrolase-like protein n=1 Tax=Neptunicoccus sediminis TaxID=1892596 RepID=UPI000845D59B|nr:HAD hydrolase-like protein [Neptunicoccus sediminis]